MDQDLKEFRDKVDHDFLQIRDAVSKLSDKVDCNYQIHQKRLNGLQMAMQGKTFVDLCAVAKFDERISALEKRVPRPPKPK
jgi:hypothetical protein